MASTSSRLKEKLEKKAKERGYSKSRANRFIYGTLAKVQARNGNKKDA